MFTTVSKLWQWIVVLLHGNYHFPKYTITPLGVTNELAEGPFWDEDTQRLYFLDMKKNILNSYDPVTDKQVRVKIETERSPVTFMVRVKGTRDRWVVGLKGAIAVVRWDGLSTEPLTPKYFADLEDPDSKSRLNDAKVDPGYRLWAGSMGAQISSNPNKFEKNKGSLYMVDADGSVSKKESNLQLANGIEWSLGADKMYFVDSLAYKIYQYDYNNGDGSIGNKKVIYDLQKERLVTAMNSLPDGITIDLEGMLWISVYGTQKVIRINPNTGKLLLDITLPKVLQPTSVAFGGKDLDILFVTTAKVDWTDTYERKYPLSGKLIKITGLGVRGKPSRAFALDRSIWQDV